MLEIGSRPTQMCRPHTMRVLTAAASANTAVVELIIVVAWGHVERNRLQR